jgi:hypothetical protein
MSQTLLGDFSGGFVTLDDFLVDALLFTFEVRFFSAKLVTFCDFSATLADFLDFSTAFDEFSFELDTFDNFSFFTLADRGDLGDF